jgi:hypothetical protein
VPLNDWSVVFKLTAMGVDLRSKDRRMLVDTQCSQSVCSCLNCLYTLIHAYVPQFDFAASTTADQLTLTPSLEVHISDPLPMLFPYFDHRCCWLLSLVVYSNGAISKSGDEHVAFDLIRRQGCDT